MKSIRRCQHIISFIIVMFIIGMAVLVLKIQREAPFYMMNSDHHELGFVYDRKGDVLFDGTGENQYPDNYFIDIGNIIGDDSGQMNNTLVAQNIEKLNNYSFSGGLTSNGRASIYTTMDHEANRACSAIPRSSPSPSCPRTRRSLCLSDSVSIPETT